ncbi:MAG: hypothetical protein ACE5ID_02565 [Acidobacteriota bacterium]
MPILGEADLPRGLARMVAAGRLTPEEARRRARRRARLLEDASTERMAPSWLTTGRVISAGLILGLTAVLMMENGRLNRSSWTAVPRLGSTRDESPIKIMAAPPVTIHPSGARPAADSVEILRDASGRLTRIAAHSPAAVLKAYCRAGQQEAACRSEAIGPLEPRRLGFRLGLFRRTVERGAIRIRRDSRTSDWVAGNGVTPIPVEKTPDYPPGIIPVPVG